MPRNKPWGSPLLWGGFLSLLLWGPIQAQDEWVLTSPDDDVLTGIIVLQATNTLDARNVIASGAGATYRAGSVITLREGFTAEEGSNFLARIGITTDDIRVQAADFPQESQTLATQVAWEDKLLIYPNPNSGQFHLKIDLDAQDLASEDTWQVEIHQPGGGKVFTRALPSAAHFEVNIREASRGQYLLILRRNAEVMTSQIMIVR